MPTIPEASTVGLASFKPHRSTLRSSIVIPRFLQQTIKKNGSNSNWDGAPHLQKNRAQPPTTAVGSVWSCADALAMLRAGGALVQLYTGFVYEGPPAVNRIKRALARALERDNVKSVKDLIGADVR
jgi:hypothetical protein